MTDADVDARTSAPAATFLLLARCARCRQRVCLQIAQPPLFRAKRGRRRVLHPATSASSSSWLLRRRRVASGAARRHEIPARARRHARELSPFRRVPAGRRAARAVARRHPRCSSGSPPATGSSRMPTASSPWPTRLHNADHLRELQPDEANQGAQSSLVRIAPSAIHGITPHQHGLRRTSEFRALAASYRDIDGIKPPMIVRTGPPRPRPRKPVGASPTTRRSAARRWTSTKRRRAETPRHQLDAEGACTRQRRG
jgi:hypothetical protein